jgi:hypothetical protein
MRLKTEHKKKSTGIASTHGSQKKLQSVTKYDEKMKEKKVCTLVHVVGHPHSTR